MPAGGIKPPLYPYQGYVLSLHYTGSKLSKGLSVILLISKKYYNIQYNCISE